MGGYSGVFDVHNHIGALVVSPHADGGGDVDIDDDYRRRTALMDRFGVTKGAVMPALQYERPNGQADTRRVNDLMAQYKRRFAERFPVAMGTVEPLHGEKLGVAELQRMRHELELDAVVWHHRMQGSQIADRRMRAFLREAEALRLPAFIHLFAESTLEASWGLEILAEEFPGVTFVALDAFSGHTQTRYMFSLAKRCSNVLFETGVLFLMGRIVEEFVGTFGSERLLYGSDLYVNPPAYEVPHVLNEIRAAAIAPRDRANVLWANAARLFGLSA
jgi:predicted TIM-barrel fold metal-dependent hydrolase